MKQKGTLLWIGKSIGVLLFWLGVWYFAAYLVDKAVVLPYPHSVAQKLAELVQTTLFWRSAALSLVRVFGGFLLGMVAGILLAVAAHRTAVVDTLFSPLITIIRATPVASFIVLLLVLMNRAQIPTFICVLMVTPIVYANLRAGLAKVDLGLVEVAQVYRFSFVKRVRYLYAPSIAPYLISAARTSLGLAWKAGIAAEVLCATKNSIGAEILDSKTYLETDSLFAWTAVVIVLSLLLEQGMLWLVKRIDRKLRHVPGQEVGV